MDSSVFDAKMCLLGSQSWICWRLCLLPDEKYVSSGKKWDHCTHLRGSHTSSWCRPAGVVPPTALLPVSLVYLPRLKSHQAPRLKDDWPPHDSMNQFLFVECPNSCKALCSWWHAPASLQTSWNCTELCVVKFNSIWPWNRVHGYQSV